MNSLWPSKLNPVLWCLQISIKLYRSWSVFYTMRVNTHYSCVMRYRTACISGYLTDLFLSGITMAIPRNRQFITTMLLSFFVSGCVSIGHDFEETQISLLQSNVTTLSEASSLLGAEPITFVKGVCEEITVSWRYTTMNIITAHSHVKEAVLIFDGQGRFIRIHHFKNI